MLAVVLLAPAVVGRLPERADRGQPLRDAAPAQCCPPSLSNRAASSDGGFYAQPADRRALCKLH